MQVREEIVEQSVVCEALNECIQLQSAWWRYFSSLGFAKVSSTTCGGAIEVGSFVASNELDQYPYTLSTLSSFGES